MKHIDRPVTRAFLASSPSDADLQASVADTLKAICRRLLNRDQIDMSRTLFELGGDSFTFIQYVSAVLLEYDVGLTPEAVEQGQSLNDTKNIIVARLLRAQNAASVSDAPDEELALLQQAVLPKQGCVMGPVALLANRYSYFLRRQRNLEYWNVTSQVLELVEEVDHGALGRAVQDLVAYHDGLRLQAYQNESGWSQEIVSPNAVTSLSNFVYDGSSEAGEWQAFADTALQQTCSGFTFPGELFKVALIEHRQSKRGLLFVVGHHLLLDSYSLALVMADLFDLYGEYRRGGQPRLLPKTTSLLDYSWASTQYWLARASAELRYWRSLRWQRVQPVPTEFEPGPDANSERHTALAVRFMPVGAAEPFLMQVAEQSQYPFFVLVLTAIAKAYHRWTGHDVLHLATVFHGREALFPGMDLARTVGWLSETVPLLLEGSQPAEDLLSAVHEQVRQAGARGRGYGVLRHLCVDESVKRELEQHPDAAISLNVQLPMRRAASSTEAAKPSTRFRRPAESIGDTPRVFLISGGVYFRDGGLYISWDFSRKLFSEAHVQAFTDACADELMTLLEPRPFPHQSAND